MKRPIPTYNLYAFTPMREWSSQHWTLLHLLSLDANCEGLCQGDVWMDLVAENLAQGGRISRLGVCVMKELEEHLLSGGTYRNYDTSYVPCGPGLRS